MATVANLCRERERAIEQWTIRSLLSFSPLISISGKELNFVEKVLGSFCGISLKLGLDLSATKKSLLARKVIADHRAVVVS